MNPVLRKSFMATAIAALIASPAWAGTEAEQAQPTVEPGAVQRDGVADSDRAIDQMADQHPAIKGTRSGELFTKTPQELEGTQVVDSSGEEIGTVRSVVSNRAKPDELHAVISQAGEGAQGEEMLLSLDELRWQNDKLHATAVKADLQGHMTPYQADQYTEIEPADQPLSEFSAFEPIPGDATPDAEATPEQPAQPGQRSVQPGEQPSQSTEPASPVN